MNRQILRLAIPNIISNLSVPLLGVVDTAVVGHLEEVYYLGALAIGATIFNFVFWGFGFLRMGTTGLTAQAFGANKKEEVTATLYRVQLIGLIIGLLILSLQHGILELSFYLIESSSEVEEFARSYYKIRIYSAPATLALYGLNGWFLGMQNARIPMLLTILLNILNIALNLIFVLALNMNVDGVALGSLISSYVTLLAGFMLLRKEYSLYLNRIGRSIMLQKEAFLRLFQVNRDIFIRTICLIFTFTFFTAVSSSFGDEVLAVNTILLQFWFIASYGIDGFAYAAESLVGKFSGSGDRKGLLEAVKGTMLWGMVLGISGSLIYLVLHDQMLHIFTDKQAVIEGAKEVIAWTILAPLISSVCYIWDGVYIGATATAPMRNSMIISTCLVFFPLYVVTKPYLGFEALWLALLMFMLSRGLMLSIFAKRSIFQVTGKQNLPA